MRGRSLKEAELEAVMPKGKLMEIDEAEAELNGGRSCRGCCKELLPTTLTNLQSSLIDCV
jgi:hypothetical protein